MNTTWSDYIQGIPTLYESRRLRFSDAFAPQFKALFALNAEKPLKILEIGCGPGALCGVLHRWYPQAVVTGLDRDSAFIRFAQEHEKGIRFLEGDAAALPFADNSFDVKISNTVAEHIEPPAVSARVAHKMINADRHGALDAVDSVIHALPGQFSEEEIDAVKRSIHQKYDKRIT